MRMKHSTKGLVKQKRYDVVDELYTELSCLIIKTDLTIEQALEHFNYLHPITFARLKKRAYAIYIGSSIVS